jgi:hypothetical protein
LITKIIATSLAPFAIETGSNAEVRQEAAMSLINGDKSRANRQRKQNIQRRLRDLALAHTEAVKPNQASAPKKAKSAIHPEPTAP